MGDEETGPPNPEVSREPVEIKFGDVVQFFSDGKPVDSLFVITDPGNETDTHASKILEDKIGEEHLAPEGTLDFPLELVGCSWPLEKIIDGAVRHYRREDRTEIPGIREAYTKSFTAYSQKPPVMYRGGA